MTSKLLVASLGTLLYGLATAAPAAGPREELKKLTAQLQTSPSDQALRERIIALAAKLKPPPALPEEAKRRMARGKAGFKTAEKPEDYKAASEEFRQAALAAPWWADAYFNLGQAQEKAGDLPDARASLALYLKAAPNAADAESVREKLYELEFMEEKKKAKAADLAGKWATQGARDEGRYTVEIYKDGSGGYGARLPETRKTTPQGHTVTMELENLRAGAGSVSFRQRTTIYMGNTVRAYDDYALTLSADGNTLAGNRCTSHWGDSCENHAETLYRVE